jgi:hypothetical protein
MKTIKPGQRVLVKRCLVQKPVYGPHGWIVDDMAYDENARESLNAVGLVCAWSSRGGIHAVGFTDGERQCLVLAHEDDMQPTDEPCSWPHGIGYSEPLYRLSHQD